MLIVSLPIAAEKRLLQLLKQLWVLPVDIRLSAHTNKLRFRPRSYSYVGTRAVPRPLRQADRRLGPRRQARASTASSRSLALVLLLAGDAGGRDRHRARQPRPGVLPPEALRLQQRADRGLQVPLDVPPHGRPDAEQARDADDPRVTRVGRFIRKTVIDELPQLFNVAARQPVAGRPAPACASTAKAADRLYEQVVDGYFARHRVKPGITGWAQINGWRGETDTPEKLERRVEHDLYYIENWSVIFDLYILFLTPFRLFNTENAY